MDIEEKNETIVEYRLRLIRNLNDLSQRELANAINVSRSLINNWENGINDIPLGNLMKISFYFKVPIDYFLGLTTNYDSNDYEYKRELDKKLLGKNIKIIRNLEDLSQIELSEKLHISRPLVSFYEQGKCSMSTNILKELCFLYGYSADWCVGNTKKCIRRPKKKLIKKEEYNVTPLLNQKYLENYS